MRISPPDGWKLKTCLNCAGDQKATVGLTLTFLLQLFNLFAKVVVNSFDLSGNALASQSKCIQIICQTRVPPRCPLCSKCREHPKR
jgi:hypothetical protein